MESQARPPREVVILGSTGSIGTQALDIIRRNPGRFRVVALAAGGGNPELLARQAAEYGVAAVAVASPAAAAAASSAALRASAEPHRARTPGTPAPGRHRRCCRAGRGLRGGRAGRATWCSTA